MRAGMPVATPADGTVYVVAGTAGAKLHPMMQQPWTANAQQSYSFLLITARVGQLDVRAYAPDNTTTPLDELMITKP